MTREEFLQSLDQALDLPAGTLKGGEKLEELDSWDSVAMVTFIALADEHSGVNVAPRQIASCVTVNDLLALAKF
mgnify:CR=1 FL=1